MEVKLDGLAYRWDGRNWTDPDDGLPPVSLRHRLSQMFAAEINAMDDAISDPSELTKLAQHAANANDQGRAIKLAKRAFEMDSQNEGRAATLVSVYRKVHRSDAAVFILDAFPNTRFGPLLTTLAALLCDLERWEEAHLKIKRALAINKSGEAFAVYSRIKKERPDLITKRPDLIG